MEAHACGFRFRASAPEDQKQSPISWHAHRHLRIPRGLHLLVAAEQKAQDARRPNASEDKDAIQVGLPGLECVTQRLKIRRNDIMSREVGIYEVNSQVAAVEIRTGQDDTVFSCLIGQKSIQESLKLEIPERI